ncbi:helix-turn-helix domain-containing protein [Taibaiella soli]|uniref:XRE family transcriptional regulator n=1 Tax=Taibaiella soli TaxID=1649169 RepID=A0A2W2B3N2_9BACT|nr:helix-turn-helix transcriptional regulator [Taibaiella soli]PZF70787.1 XRE family transcriptional regulator [Taibaiella soli]
MTAHRIHVGRNIKRFREMLGIKQESLAFDLGDDWTQKKVSQLESKDTIEPDILEKVAKALKLPTQALENFDEETAILNIQNNYDNVTSPSSIANTEANAETINETTNVECTFNPIDKIVELYERMLKDKEEMIKRLEEMVRK